MISTQLETIYQLFQDLGKVQNLQFFPRFQPKFATTNPVLKHFLIHEGYLVATIVLVA